MKYLLPLILVCALLCGCSQAPLLTHTISLEETQGTIGGAETQPDIPLPGDLTGTPIPSPDGQKLFYSTGTDLRAWDRQQGIHRRIRELTGPQTLTDVLLEGSVLQCVSEESGKPQTLFYSSADGQLLYCFDGEIRIKTDTDGFSAAFPLGNLTVTVFGEYNAQPRMVLGDASRREAVPYCTSESPDAAGLADCRAAAQLLEEDYGFHISLWDEAAKNPALTGEHLVPVIRRELAVLSQRLSVFPETMLQDTASHFTGLTVCLVRHRSDALPCAQFWDGETLCFALESGHSGQELYHALFHAMETHIWGNSKAFDRWNDLNPVGFAYDGDYTANRIRDSGIYLLGEHRAFPSQFSMSFAREDRAEVFACAMMPGNEALFRTEVMQKKLAVLCGGIREAFGLKEYDGALLWEQYLN